MKEVATTGATGRCNGQVQRAGATGSILADALLVDPTDLAAPLSLRRR